MNQPIVSILVPVFNVEKYLERCLKSITQQTVQNIEIICVNDGSTDNSLEILQKYKKSDSRIIIINKKNGGLPSARNAGLEVASGKYIGFVDSDDYIEENMYEKMIQVAQEDNSEVVICGANIFPEEPKASEWLYQCLSPYRSYYKKYDSDILFSRCDTSPFLWRMLVKRELIERNSFRLDEDISLGEDKAFQCKIMPAANGISIIPDKLYNYYWCRPESLMQNLVYEGLEIKVEKHALLVERIGTDILKRLDKISSDNSEMRAYLEWSIPFIYDDYIYLSYNKKCKLSKQLISIWKKVGYYKIKQLLPKWKQDAFEYICKFINLQPKKHKLSIIIPVEFNSRYIDDMLDILLFAGEDKYEIIFVNNGMKDENYIKVLKFLNKMKNARLFNTPKHTSYGEALNIGTSLSSGKYILYYDVEDWILSFDKLDKWLKDALINAADISVSNFCEKHIKTETNQNERKAVVSNCGQLFMMDFHSCLYKKDFIKDNVEFKEASIVTGFCFLCKVIMNATNIIAYDDNVYAVREKWKRDWISTEKCEVVLENLNELMDVSIEKKNPYLHGAIIALLCGDYLKQIIVNNTKPYVMPVDKCPNGENSQLRTVDTIFDIFRKIDNQMLYEFGFTENDTYLHLIYEIIEERQKFLGNLSNEVCSK